MLNDIDLLSTKLGKVDGFGDTGDYLQKIIKSKQVKTEEAPADKPSDEKKVEETSKPAAETESAKDEEKK